LPESGGHVQGRVVLLAIDDQALRGRQGLTLTLTRPEVRREPVLVPERGNPSAPDAMASHFYGTVLRDQGKYRMWYYAVSPKEDAPEKLKQGPVCYAESSDGIHWTKPHLGQVEINGSKENNAMKLPDKTTQCVAVIRDDGDSNPARRYKMLYTALSDTWLFRPATSPDGLHWTAAADFPTGHFLEMGSFIRFEDHYIVHGQGAGKNSRGNPEGRQGYASTSTDFVHWDQDYRRSFRLPEPDDVSLRGLTGDYPQVHLGVGAASFGNVAVGLYGIWHNPPVGKRRQDGWYGAGLITCDLGLLVSDDGVHFREPVPGAVFISGQDSPVTPLPGGEDPTILCQANGILNVGSQTLIYHGRWRNATNTGKDYYAEIALATLRRDRWGALYLAEGAMEGMVWSAPITLPASGCTIALNASGADRISVELADENGTLLPNYSGKSRGAVRGDSGNAIAVEWVGKDLAELGGKTIRIKLALSDKSARLYAVYLDAKK